jgi:hypothetical protein
MSEKLKIEVGFLPEYMSDKEAMVKVYDEAGYIHVAWKLQNGAIISFEDIPQNYPRSNMCVWKDLEEYIEGISGVDWIVRSILGREEAIGLGEQTIRQKLREEISDV